MFTHKTSYLQLPLSFIANELAFDSVSDAHHFLSEHLIAVYTSTGQTASDNEKCLDCKTVHPRVVACYEEKYKKVDIVGRI